MGIVLATEVISFKKSPEKIMMGDVGLKKKPGFSQAAQKAKASWCVASSAVLSNSCNKPSAKFY